MASSAFSATYSAASQITRTFDMVWGLTAGLWKLRADTAGYFKTHPDSTNKEIVAELFHGSGIHGLNPKRLTDDLSWEDEQQYIAELLLVNATAIFDAWTESYVNSVLINTSKTKKKDIVSYMQKGDISSFEAELSQLPQSQYSGCFKIPPKRQDRYISNLLLIYKFFKACRNCSAHGNSVFSLSAETKYNNISNLSAADCGLKEFPRIIPAVSGSSFSVDLRGIVGFYDVLLRIINHYDVVASTKDSFDKEILIRWASFPSLEVSRNVNKRNQSIVKHFECNHMFPPLRKNVNDVAKYLISNSLLKWAP